MFNRIAGSMISEHEQEKEWLQRPFEEEEVFECIKLCAVDKAPRPDGFNMGFYIHCCDIIKEDIMQTIHNFHNQEFLEKKFQCHIRIIDS